MTGTKRVIVAAAVATTAAAFIHDRTVLNERVSPPDRILPSESLLAASALGVFVGGIVAVLIGIGRLPVAIFRRLSS